MGSDPRRGIFDRVGVIRSKCVAKQSGIKRKSGVEVGVTPVDLTREAALCVGRVGFPRVKRVR